MVDSVTKILSLVLFLVLISEGYGQCPLGSIYNRQTISGRIVSGQKEWDVQIINNCTCPLKNVVLNCAGFQTTEPVNPPVFIILDGFCVVNEGAPIYPGIGGTVAFQYAWTDKFPFTPSSFDVACP